MTHLEKDPAAESDSPQELVELQDWVSVSGRIDHNFRIHGHWLSGADLELLLPGWYQGCENRGDHTQRGAAGDRVPSHERVGA